MIMNIYVVYDMVAEEAGPLFTAVNDAVARRNFHNLLENTPESQRCEYVVYCIGTYDSKEMSVIGYDTNGKYPVKTLEVQK